MMKIVITFHGVHITPPDGRFTMAHDEDGSSTQTFIVKPAEKLHFKDPSQYQQLSVVVDEVKE